MSDRYTLALVGNPNSGKSTLFNRLTGSRQKVGNWSGVTVEKKTGHFSHGDTQFDVVDLPGTYSLHVSHDEDSIDQQIAQNFILDEKVDLLINIIDASSLERGLYLTAQLIEAGVPLIIALNMVDVAHQQGVHIDPYVLTENIGVPVLPIVASQGQGVDTLVDVIVNRLHGETEQPHTEIEFSRGSKVDAALASIRELMAQQGMEVNGLKASAILERDDSVMGSLDHQTWGEADAIIKTLEDESGSRSSDLLIQSRYDWIAEVVNGALHRDTGKKRNLTDWLDALLLNRVLAFPLFLGVMYLMFMFTINFGGAFIDVFDIVAGAIFVDLPARVMTALHFPEWIIALIANGAGGGIQLVASFIPVIGTLFLFQSFLEGSGYMARAAFIVDRLMRTIGLPGKSFVPLIVGFGCNVPAVMSARTLDSQSDRLLTTLMAPFMSCGARLTVYILFATVFFPAQAQNVVFGLYVFGILMAVLTGFIVQRRVLKRDMTPFIMELPNYHIPTFRGVLTSAWHRLRGFIMRAGKAIVIVVIALNFVNSMGVDGSFGNENTEKSVLSRIGMAITPVFEPIGVKEDNWPATVGIFSGIFAKEVVVGTLDSLYTSMAQEGAAQEEPAGFWDTVSEGFATIPVNLLALKDTLSDPLGIGVGDLSDQHRVAEEQSVDERTLSLMMALFNGPLAAFAYILFVLLYMPCVATLGAIYKEAGGFWAFFSATWNTVAAYGVAVICYQVGSLFLGVGASVASALIWVGAVALVWGVTYAALMHFARRSTRSDPSLIPAVNIVS
ncbi:MAG: Fe(2+) transporter permease subunit FeoB [bacterium]